MRETQILRGLHKARATMGHNYADGVVPNGPPASGFAGIGKSLSRMFSSAPKPVAPPPAPVATPPSNSGAQAIGEAVAPGAMNAIRNRKAMLDSLADGYAPDELGLRRGAVNIKGPGTTTSDSIHNVSLSKGESVLPAKTTAALGPDNIAKLIEKTNGKPPARGLRSGYVDGKVPPMSDMADDLLGKKKPPGAAGSAAFGDMADDLGGRGTGAAGEPPKRDFNNAQQNAERWAQQQRDAKAKAEAARTVPPMGSTTTAGTAPVQEPAGPQTFKQRAASTFASGKATVSGVASSAAAPLKTAAAGAKGLGAGALGGYVGNSAAEAARTIGKPTGAPVEPNANGNAIQGGVDVSRIPGASVQQTASAATMPKQQYNYFTDNEAGRNVGNTMNAAAMIPGVGQVARSALGMGTGAISRAARAAGNPLVTGAVQGAANSVRDGRGQAPVETSSQADAAQPGASATAPGATQAAANQPQPIRVERQPNGAMSFSNTADTGQNTYTGPGAAGLRRGVMNVMPAFQGGGLPAFSVGGQSYMSADNAIRAANLRDGVDLNRGTSQGQAGGIAGFNGSGDNPLRSRLEAMASSGKGMYLPQIQALESLRKADMDNLAQREGNRMQRDASMYGHDISRENNRNSNATQARGDDLQFAGTQNRLGLDRAKLSYEMTQSAAKGVNDDNLNSVYATEVDPKTGLKVKSQAKADELGQALRAAAGRMKTPDGKPVSLEQLRATNPALYQSMRTAIEGQKGLGEVVNEYAAGNTFGQKGGWAPPNITNVREMGPSDFPKGASLTDALLAPFKPGYRSQGVEIDVGGRKQVVPLSELFAGEHGGQYRQLVNEWLKANKRPILGDMNTGE